MNTYEKIYNMLIEDKSTASERGKKAGTKERAKKMLQKGTGWGSMLVQQRARTRGVVHGAEEKRRRGK